MELTLYVFDRSITPLGAVDIVTGLTWGEQFSDVGSFELWCPLNDRNTQLLVEDNLVWPGEGDTAGIIELKESAMDEEGKLTIHVKGRLAESYFDYRTLYPTLILTAPVSTIFRTMLDKNVINPVDTNRTIPRISVASDQEVLGPSVSYQKTGSTVLTEMSKLSEANSLGFKLQFFPKQFKFVFRAYKGTDRTIEQSAVNPVTFSSDLDDILTSAYSHNKSELRNLAYVAGEDSGEARKVQIIGTASGLDRRELYVDARDLQTEKPDGTIIPEEEYRAMLTERGKTSLEDFKDIETFDATLKSFDVTGYKYGVDYFLGDTVTVYDGKLKVRTNAVVTAVTTTYNENGKTLDVTFGYGQPTLATKLKRRT